MNYNTSNGIFGGGVAFGHLGVQWAAAGFGDDATPFTSVSGTSVITPAAQAELWAKFGASRAYQEGSNPTFEGGDAVSRAYFSHNAWSQGLIDAAASVSQVVSEATNKNFFVLVTKDSALGKPLPIDLSFPMSVAVTPGTIRFTLVPDNNVPAALALASDSGPWAIWFISSGYTMSTVPGLIGGPGDIPKPPSPVDPCPVGTTLQYIPGRACVPLPQLPAVSTTDERPPGLYAVLVNGVTTFDAPSQAAILDSLGTMTASALAEQDRFLSTTVTPGNSGGETARQMVAATLRASVPGTGAFAQMSFSGMTPSTIVFAPASTTYPQFTINGKPELFGLLLTLDQIGTPIPAPPPAKTPPPWQKQPAGAPAQNQASMSEGAKTGWALAFAAVGIGIAVYFANKKA